MLCKWKDLEEGSAAEQVTALDTWHKYEQLTSVHSQQLCEQLRIVLEPSIANKLRYACYVCRQYQWTIKTTCMHTASSIPNDTD